MFNTKNAIAACLTAVVSPGRMPLPSLGQPDPLGDDPISNLARAAEQLMVERDVGASPCRFLSVSSAEGITFSQISPDIKFALHLFYVSDEGFAVEEKGNF